MATSNGIVRFSGQLGDLIFYRRNNKEVVRTKPSTYQLSEKSKKSAKDFGEVSKNGAYIRKAFSTMVADYGNGDLVSRLTQCLTRVFKTIPSSYLGNKKLKDANFKVLEGFEFNADRALNKLLLFQPIVSFSPKGFVELLIPKMELKKLIRRVQKADAFQLQVSVFNFDLNDGGYEVLKVNNLEMPFGQQHFPGAKLSIPIEHADERGLLVALGVSYLHQQTRITDQRYFACQILYAAHLLDGEEVAFVVEEQEAIVDDQPENMLSWELGGE